MRSSWAAVSRLVDASAPPNWSLCVTSPLRLETEAERFLYQNLSFSRVIYDLQIPNAVLLGEAAVASHVRILFFPNSLSLLLCFTLHPIVQATQQPRADTDALFLRALEAGPRVGSNLVR